jgi:hypothetical protein
MTVLKLWIENRASLWYPRLNSIDTPDIIWSGSRWTLPASAKKYAGAQALYELEVEGDDVILEYLKADKTTADYGFKTAHISLPGNIDQVEKALRIISSEYCKADTPKSPF